MDRRIVEVVLFWSWMWISLVGGRTASDSNVTLRFLSFNTFLAAPRTTTRAIEQRLAALRDQLSDETSALNQADVICLQEVQNVSDLKSVQSAARTGGFAHSYSFLDALSVSPESLARGAESACNAVSLATIQPCLMQCDQTQGIRLVVSCVLNRCRPQVQQARPSSACLNCLSNLGLPGLVRCAASEKRADHEPTYGLLLLSKHPLLSASAVEFPVPTGFVDLYSRGYLQVDVQTSNGAGNWQVICGHLYPRVNGAPYTGPFTSAQQENLNNTETILNAAGSAQNVVLMGDMNHSPLRAATSVQALFADNYNAVGQQQFCAPYANSTNPQCTFCATNPLANGNENTIVDHIYLRVNGSQCPVLSAKRVLSGMTVSYQNTTLPLSDHYGVEVTASVPMVATTVSQSASSCLSILGKGTLLIIYCFLFLLQ